MPIMHSEELEDYYSESRKEILQYLPKNCKTLLDVGCGEGNFAYLVKQKLGVEVWGVEVNKKAAGYAEKKLNNVIVGDFISNTKLLPELYFDCITFNDVLEHMINPLEALAICKKLLTKNGIIIASIPNVRYFENLWNLLINKDWEYKSSGILDNTHLRFFTRKSIERMFISKGFHILELKGLNYFESRKYKLINALSFGSISDTKYVQFICIAKPIE